MSLTPSYRPLPGRESDQCFGCSDSNPSGLRMKFYTDGESLFSDLTVPPHMASWRNMAHGGIITTILDEMMSWAAIHFLKRFILTKSIQVEFLRPVYIGKPMKGQGKVASLLNEREVGMEAVLVDEEGVPCARASGTLALFTPEAAVRLGIIGSADLAEVEALFGE